jgi:hypothetical protein
MTAMPAASYEVLDEALEAVAGFGIELTTGNTNHAPMAAEALCALGRPDAVMPWIGRYRARMLPCPVAGDRILPADWRGALGQRERYADWAGLFAEALREAPWRVVLDRWVGRLAAGFCAAATHGVIRVGHAARSLGGGQRRRPGSASSPLPWRAGPPPTRNCRPLSGGAARCCSIARSPPCR